MNQIISSLSKLGVWSFILWFTLISILLSEISVVFQSYWLTNHFFEKNLLISGFISSAISGLIIFFLVVLFIRYMINNQTRFQEAQKVAHIGIWEHDIKHNKLYLNDEIYVILGLKPQEIEITPETFLEYVHPEDKTALTQEYLSSIKEKREYKIVHRVMQANGTIHYVEEKCKHYFNENDEAVKSIGTMYDITERKEAEEKLELMSKIYTNTQEGMIITDAENQIIDVNKAFVRITGYSRNEVLGKNPHILKSKRYDESFYHEMWKEIEKDGFWQGELWNKKKNGKDFAVHLTINTIHNDKQIIQNYIGIFADITHQKMEEKVLEYNAYYDNLTNLPNRLLFSDRMQQAMAQASRREQFIAVAYLDLDGFKAINDTHGHNIGDKLLIHISSQMKNLLREGDTVARVGGDEFILLFIDLPNKTTVHAFLPRLLKSLSQPIHIDELTVQVSASIGISFYPQAEFINAEQLIRQADRAMYQAKTSGKNRYFIFELPVEDNL